MKTNQITQIKEQREIHKDRTDSNQHLEDDEKILYSESVETSEESLVGIATTLFLIFGFPFYIVIGFTALTAYLSERTLSEFGQDVMWPAAILVVVAGSSIFLAFACRSAFRAIAGGQGTKFLITNKRIYNHNPNSILPVMFESRYPDVLYIYPEKMGKHEYLQLRVKALETCEDGSTRIVENRHTFRVKDAQKAFMQVPDQVRWQCSEKSKSGAIYKEKTKRETIFALCGLTLLVGFLAFVVVTVDAQIAVHNLMQDGKMLFKQGKNVQAEHVLRDAYLKIKPFHFHAEYGPVCYRYARVLQTNGELNKAIPFYLQAIESCNWLDTEDDVTWKPAVFRSNVHLAEIYATEKKDGEAERYYDRALETAPLETDENRVRKLFSDYQNFLTARAKVGKSALVSQLNASFKVSPQYVKTFSNWSEN